MTLKTFYHKISVRIPYIVDREAATKLCNLIVEDFVVFSDKIKERREYDKCSSVSLRLQLGTPDSILGAATASKCPGVCGSVLH